MAQHMDLYTDCPECDGKGYQIRRMYNETEPHRTQCASCHNTGTVPVRVKALEWEDGPNQGIVCYTDCFVVSYDISRNDTGGFAIEMRQYQGGDMVISRVVASNVEAAKAACQAHHERMVMAMLEITP